MEGDVYMTKVNLRTHMPDEKERRGQSRETAIEASTRTNFFFTNDRTFLIGSKRTVCCFDDVAVGRRADVYCTFAQGKIIRFSIAPGDLQSKSLRTAFQMEKNSFRRLDAQMLE